MKTKETTVKTIQPFVDIVVDFLIESIPAENLPACRSHFCFGHYEPQAAHHAAEL
jgi:hypothetical protein